MKHVKQRLAAVLILALFASVFTACMGSGNQGSGGSDGGGATPAPSAQPSATPAASPQIGFPLIPTDVEESSDLPDWTGKQLELTVWFGHGTTVDIDQRRSEGDVVNPEIKRVTGVSLNMDKWFDNNGQTPDVKLGLLAASNDWPHIASNVPVKDLAEADKIYDLTDLLPKYAPNIMKKIVNNPAFSTIFGGPNNGDARVTGGFPGKIYGVPLNIRDYIPPDVDIAKTLYSPVEWDFVYVRDDILKQLYPNAKTRKELEELLEKQGYFTERDIYDVPINSKEDFYKFLRDIDALNVKEGSQNVETFFTFSGGDNWPLLSFLSGALNGYTARSNYFTYWDKEEQRVKWMFKEPFFVETLREMNKLVRDGVASKEAFVDPANIFREKLDNGLYAVSYAWHEPNNALLEQADKPYRYRRVFLNIPPDYDKFPITMTNPVPNENIVIFKDAVKEEDVPQILRWLDFLVSDAGENLRWWGPRSAGLFEEVNGKRQYKDPELADHFLYNKPTEKALYYNLYNGSRESGIRTGVFTFLNNNAFSVPHTKFHPEHHYERKADGALVNTYFNSTRVRKLDLVQTGILPNITSFTATIPEVEEAWKARQAFEDALVKVLAASSDEQFEKLYNDFLTLAEQSGYNDKTLALIDEAFRRENAAYMDNLK